MEQVRSHSPVRNPETAGFGNVVEQLGRAIRPIGHPETLRLADPVHPRPRLPLERLPDDAPRSAGPGLDRFPVGGLDPGRRAGPRRRGGRLWNSSRSRWKLRNDRGSLATRSEVLVRFWNRPAIRVDGWPERRLTPPARPALCALAWGGVPGRLPRGRRRLSRRLLRDPAPADAPDFGLGCSPEKERRRCARAVSATSRSSRS